MDRSTPTNLNDLKRNDMAIVRNGLSARNGLASTAAEEAAVVKTSVADAEADYDSDDLAYRSNDEDAGRLKQNEPRKPPKVSLKKKIEQANFGKWLDNNRVSLTKKSGQHVTQNDQSIGYLVRGWEGESIIDKPRDYQLELFERAKEKNTIAVLDTGKLSKLSIRTLYTIE